MEHGERILSLHDQGTQSSTRQPCQSQWPSCPSAQNFTTALSNNKSYNFTAAYPPVFVRFRQITEGTLGWKIHYSCSWLKSKQAEKTNVITENAVRHGLSYFVTAFWAHFNMTDFAPLLTFPTTDLLTERDTGAFPLLFGQETFSREEAHIVCFSINRVFSSI